MKKLVLILDTKHSIERQSGALTHEGGKLLRFFIARLSIPREAWVHGYCNHSWKGKLPGNKKVRLATLRRDFEKTTAFIKLNRPCVVVGLGKLACEYLTDASLVGSKAGTCWRNVDHGYVWVTYSPDACLYDRSLITNIYGVLANAAKAAEIKTQFNPKIPMYPFDEAQGFWEKQSKANQPEHPWR